MNMFKALADLLRFILVLTRPLSDRVLDLIYLVFMGKTKILPPIDDEILLMTAIELAEKIRKKQLSCEEVMRVYVQRSQTVHPYINAVVDERYEDAMDEARAVDIFLTITMKTEEEILKDTPLLGVPFSCKETIGVKGMAQMNGLVRAKGRVAPEDSDTAALYRKAGAIPYVVTNVPELCLWWESANVINGMTKNPYDNRRSVGGSSGGEGSIITSAAAVIGIGNDVAGSIRLPASFCGIYGHKPSRDVISNKGVFPEESDIWDEVVSTGPMCRYADDLPLLSRLLADNNKNVRWDEKVDFRKVKIFYMEEFPGFLLRSVPDVKAAIKKAAKHFEDEYGNKAIRLRMDEMQYAFDMWESRILDLGGLQIKAEMSEDGNINLYWELIKSFFGCSDHSLPAIYFGIIENCNKDKYYYKYSKLYKEFEKNIEEVLEGDTILLLPTQPEPPPHYLMTIPKYPSIGYTSIFNALGYPSTQVPVGLSDGVPIGIQVISRRFQDHLTIASGVELDKVFGGWISPCPVSV
ncbi:fatty-acid amide hydrolase 2-B [Nephila pilipes]|uniref:Fatty-acid amide hydrolase 2-B n=1 Tax=Nephila pilipes TaxID=299642 RepID=A0A8X6PAL0_NEPPI|nr:fatty-acid amide hydrolase 2-B [Nephila pilipes]